MVPSSGSAAPPQADVENSSGSELGSGHNDSIKTLDDAENAERGSQASEDLGNNTNDDDNYNNNEDNKYNGISNFHFMRIFTNLSVLFVTSNSCFKNLFYSWAGEKSNGERSDSPGAGKGTPGSTRMLTRLRNPDSKLSQMKSQQVAAAANEANKLYKETREVCAHLGKLKELQKML